MEISYLILLVIFATAIIQSIFGVGLLLFGTPLLLLIGLNFSRVLSVLLPCSIVVSVFQIIRDYKYIEWSLVRRVLLISVPLIIIFLLISLSLNKSFNFNKMIGALLIVLALLSLFKINLVQKIKFNKSDSLYFVFLGIVHGLSNIGGSLLSVYVKEYCKNKKAIRGTIAINYLMFAIIQICVLFLSKKLFVFNTDWLNIALVMLTTLSIGNWIFIKFSEVFYNKVLNLLILSIGVFFVLK
jgi:hypothetical protein